MRLKKVTLNNFRCFEKLEVDLHPRLTVLVGDNGAGKTAVLDGIAIALSPILTYLSSANQRLTGRGILDSDFRILPQAQGGYWRNTVDATQLEVETDDGLTWDVRRASRTGKLPANGIGQSELKNRLQGVADSYAQPVPQATPVIAYYGAGRGYIEVPRRLHQSKVNYEYPSAALVDALNSYSNFREVLAWFDQEEATELRQNKGAPITDINPSHTLSAVRKAIVELLRGDYKNPQFTAQHRFVIERKADGTQLLVDQLSQGYQSMLALAMDFSRRLAIANRHANEVNQASAIMLVDEIDIHLHPTWQQRVLGDLMHAFPNTQFIVTTHSPQVLSTVAREHIRVLQCIDGKHSADMPGFSPLAHESGDALAKIMGTHREPELAVQDDIRRYEQLVRAGKEQETDTQALRVHLEQLGYQFHESDLTKWRFLAKNAKPKGN